jgi:hypothetical protein
MVQNRIRRYESLWSDRPEPAAGVSNNLPEGFVVQPLSHLSFEQRQAISQQSQLYQWAYDQARKESDQKLFWDWSI